MNADEKKIYIKEMISRIEHESDVDPNDLCKSYLTIDWDGSYEMDMLEKFMMKMTCQMAGFTNSDKPLVRAAIHEYMER